MRTKFEKPIVPSDKELLFIQYMDGTHDSYGLREETLSLFLSTNGRTIRKWKERYNNFKYIGVIPQGKIHCINGLYKMVRQGSKYERKYILQSQLNFVCGIIDKHNTSRILGEIQHEGQQDIFNMSYDELIAYQEYLSKELEERK